MTKTLIIGDLHGKWKIAETVLKTSHNIVFVGDYIDSEGINIPDQLKTLDLVLNAATKEPNRVIAIRGNHELSYETDQQHEGWTPLIHKLIKDRIDKFKILKDYFWLDNILISHAGVSKELLLHEKKTLEQYLKEENFSQKGYSKNGDKPYGGLYWCDWLTEFQHIKDIPQVVGHSEKRLSFKKGILQKGNSYNIDCLNHIHEILCYRKKQFQIVSLHQTLN